MALRNVQVWAQWIRLLCMAVYTIVCFVLTSSSASGSWGHLCPVYINDGDGSESEVVVSACDWIEYMDFHSCPFERVADQCSSVNAACNCDESIRRLIEAQTNMTTTESTSDAGETVSLRLRTRDKTPKCAATENTDFLSLSMTLTAFMLFALFAATFKLDSQMLGSMGDGSNSVTVHRGPSVTKMVFVLLIMCTQLLTTLFRVAASGAFPGWSPPGATVNGLSVVGAKQFHMDVFMHSFLVCVPASGDCGKAGGALGTTPYAWKRAIDLDVLGGGSAYAVVCFIELLFFYLLLMEVMVLCIQYVMFDPNMRVQANPLADKVRNMVSSMGSVFGGGGKAGEGQKKKQQKGGENTQSTAAAAVAPRAYSSFALPAAESSSSQQQQQQQGVAAGDVERAVGGGTQQQPQIRQNLPPLVPDAAAADASDPRTVTNNNSKPKN